MPCKHDNRCYIAVISKSSLRAPHSGQVQFIGTSAQRVPGAMPSSGAPAASSYTQPQIRHIQVRNGAVDSVLTVLILVSSKMWNQNPAS